MLAERLSTPTRASKSDNGGSQNYSADVIARDYSLRTGRNDIMSERPGEFDYKLEDDMHCHQAVAKQLRKQWSQGPNAKHNDRVRTARRHDQLSDAASWFAREHLGVA